MTESVSLLFFAALESRRNNKGKAFDHLSVIDAMWMGGVHAVLTQRGLFHAKQVSVNMIWLNKFNNLLQKYK